jgi:hypothetical protein
MNEQEMVTWSGAVRATAAKYDEALLRRVAGKLFRPRNQWPPEELIERIVGAIGNAPLIDRRFEDLTPAARRALAMMARASARTWRVGAIVGLVSALDRDAGIEPIMELVEGGLLYPVLDNDENGMRGLETWVVHCSGPRQPRVFIPEPVADRARRLELQLPRLAITEAIRAPEEADGLDWLLRLAALRQQLWRGGIRQTQQGAFFKRDYERLTNDPLLAMPAPTGAREIPEPWLLMMEMAALTGIAEEKSDEYAAGEIAASLEGSLGEALVFLLAASQEIEAWSPATGELGDNVPSNPYTAACFLGLLLLEALGQEAWTCCRLIQEWIEKHHPFWASRRTAVEDSGSKERQRSWFEAYVGAIAYPLRLVQVAQTAGGDTAVRFSEVGRAVLAGAPVASRLPSFEKTLLVQPNLEIVVYRQGLTPGLISELSNIATWKSFGAACTLELNATSVYRALESQKSFESIRQLLERHSTRALPQAVIESLRTWAEKRERLSVYTSAALFEFSKPEELDQALARGAPGVRLSDRLLAVANESEVDYRLFRLSGTRDYALPPDQCVRVEADGVTLAIDLGRADLMVEAELGRFANPADSEPGAAHYRVSVESLARARDAGMTMGGLEEWFDERTGGPPSAAILMLWHGGSLGPTGLDREWVLRVPDPDIADGLMQWPATAGLIRERLGKKALVIASADVETMRGKLRELGFEIMPGASNN